MTKEVLKLALEALEFNQARWQGKDEAITAIKEALAQEKALQALHDENERLGLYKDAYAEPEEEKLHPVHIGVDVTREGTAVTAFYRKPDAVMEMFYSQFHPLAQPEQKPKRCSLCNYQHGHAIGCANNPVDIAIQALAQQDSKDKEQAKTDSFVRQLDEALAQPEPWEKFCDSNCVWTDHHPDCKLAQPEQEPCCYGGIAHDCHAGKGCRIVKRMKVTQKPPQRKPLSDEELVDLAFNCGVNGINIHGYTFVRAIERAHGIKDET